MRSVRRIERLETKLKTHPFTDWELAEQRRIQVYKTGSAQHVAAEIAEGRRRGRGKSTGVEPQRSRPDAFENLHLAYHVRLVIHSRHIQGSTADRDIQWGPSHGCKYAVQLPSA